MKQTKGIAADSPHKCISFAARPRRALVHAQPLVGSRINWISSITATSSVKIIYLIYNNFFDKNYIKQ